MVVRETGKAFLAVVVVAGLSEARPLLAIIGHEA